VLSISFFRVLILLKWVCKFDLIIPYLNSHISLKHLFLNSSLTVTIIHLPIQQDEPPTVSFSHSDSLPDEARPLASQLCGCVWALHNHPYLPFILFSPFHGAMTTRLSTSPEMIPLVEDVSKSWKTLAIRSSMSFVLYFIRIIPSSPSFVRLHMTCRPKSEF